MGRVKLKKLENVSPFRKVAMGTWKTAKDPSVYGLINIDMEKVLNLLPEYEKEHGVKVSPAHLVGKAAAHCMKIRPELNGMIRGSRIYLRESVSLFYQVNIPGTGQGDDKIKKATLSGAVVQEAENLNAAGIAKQLQAKSNAVRSGEDQELKKNMEMFKFLPWWFVRFYLDIASFLIYGLNWDLSFLGIPRDPFGSVMITNIGSLGLDLAWAPLCPYTRVPVLLTVGAMKEAPTVIDGKIEVRRTLPVAVTFDHRFIDGVHAAQMAFEFKKCFEDPEKYLF